MADAARVLSSVLSPLEKRCLVWMARRAPRWIGSDHLTVLALVAMAGAGMSYWLAASRPLAGLLLVNLCLALNWFGDSLDGTLARVRRHERPRYGFYVDHIVDTLGTACLLGGLALSGLMSPFVALLLLSAYFMLSIEVYLAAYSLGTFKISCFKIGPTELRLLLAAANLFAVVHPTADVFGRQYRLFDLGGTVAAALLAITMIGLAAVHTRDLYRAEPLPACGHE